MGLDVAELDFGVDEHMALDWELEASLGVVPHEHFSISRYGNQEVRHAIVGVLNLEPLQLVDGLSVEIFIRLRLLYHIDLGIFTGIPNEDFTVHGSACQYLWIIGMVGQTCDAI